MTELKRYEEDNIRWYEVPGLGKVPSATTVLKCLSKPALIGWAAKMTAEYMREILMQIARGAIAKESLTDRQIERLVKEAKTAHRAASTEAADIGSAVHAWIEDYYKGSAPDVSPEIQTPIEAFREWDRKNKVKPICVEERIWSSARYAGTLDLYAEVKGSRTIVDFKSSKAHYPSDHAMQLGAYDLAFREQTGNKVEKYFIVRLDKETGLVDPKEYSREEVESGGRRFLALLSYWWLTEGAKA